MFQVKEIYHGSQGVLKHSRVTTAATFQGKTSGLAVKFVTRGREEYTFCNEQISLTVGNFLLLPAGECYSAVHPYDDVVTEGVCIDLPQQLPEDLPLDLLCGYAFSSRPAGMNSLSPVATDQLRPSADQLNSLQREILTFGGQIQQLADRLKGEVKNTNTQRHLINLLLTTETLLTDRCTTALSLDGIAREVGVSKYHLSRLYKKAFGCTVQSRQRSLRLEKAAATIRESDTPIKYLAYSLGYSSPAAFSRQFSQHFGCSPTKWRQQSK